MKGTNFIVGYVLSRLIFGYKAYKVYVYVYKTSYSMALIEFLFRKGFVLSYFVENNYTLKVYLKYWEGQPLFRSFKILSKPTRPQYKRVDQIKLISSRKLVCVSTIKGLLSLSECLCGSYGGELLFELN